MGWVGVRSGSGSLHRKGGLSTTDLVASNWLACVLACGELRECVCFESWRVEWVAHHWAWERGPLTSVLVFQEITAALFRPAGTQAESEAIFSLTLTLARSAAALVWLRLVWFGCVQTDGRILSLQ